MNKKDFVVFCLLVVLSFLSILSSKMYAQDFSKPVLSSYTLSSDYVDITSEGVTLTTSIQASDTSGITIDSRYAALLSENNDAEERILNYDDKLYAYTLISGDQYNGTYQANKHLDPSNIPSGTFSVYDVCRSLIPMDW